MTTLTLRSILLEKFNRIVNPNFDLSFISGLFLLGLSILGIPSLLQLAGSFEFIQNDVRIKLELSNTTDVLLQSIGAVLIFTACYFFYKTRIAAKVVDSTYKTLSDATSDLYELLEENRRLFLSFGPNSSAGSIGEIRADPSMWFSIRTESIQPNNQKIAKILDSVQSFTSDERTIVDSMLNHITAFNHHCTNADFDYSQNRFPQEFRNLIHALIVDIKKPHLKTAEYASWLKLHFQNSGLKATSIHIFGSALYGTELSDVDILVNTGSDSAIDIHQDAGELKRLANEFFTYFGLRLHVTAFSKLEEKAFIDFESTIKPLQQVI